MYEKKNSFKSFIDSSRHLLEYFILKVLVTLLRLMPFHHVSNTAGWLGRTLGPRCKRLSRITVTNLTKVFPELSPEEVRGVEKRMFDNMARTFVEHFYIDKYGDLKGLTFEVKKGAYLAALKDQDIPAIIFSGHYGNWEVGAWYASTIGVPFTPIYRPPHNPFLAKYIEDLHSYISDGVIVKGARAGRETLQALKADKKLVVLMDQKQKQGEDVDFFGIPAPTPTVIARLAKSLKCPLIPTRVIRQKGTHFIIEIFEPINFDDYKDKTEADIMLMIHHYLESWIREYPEQWMWCYRRWHDSFYEN